MVIKITDKILSVPPYISTTWSQIATLHMKADVLAITLVDGEILHIPNLNPKVINLIFHYHANFLEKEQPTPNDELSKLKGIIEQEEPSIRLAFGSSLEGLGNMMQHNPNQTDAPDLPPDILQKITAITKIINPSDELLLPKAEPDCNCFHCQIARAVNPLPPEQQVASEPEVTEAELQFQQWNITQTGEKLFSVVNRLDEHETYNVYLGQPVGCTCGKEGCEHILAVLKS